MDSKPLIVFLAIVVLVSFVFSSNLSRIYRDLGFESPIPLILLLVVTLGLTVLYQSYRMKKLSG